MRNPAKIPSAAICGESRRVAAGCGGSRPESESESESESVSETERESELPDGVCADAHLSRVAKRAFLSFLNNANKCAIFEVFFAGLRLLTPGKKRIIEARGTGLEDKKSCTARMRYSRVWV